jgi:hypothetical protein
MSAPPFALPAADPIDPTAGSTPAVVSPRERGRALAAAGAKGATAMAATLAMAAGLVVFERDVIEVIARPASISEEATVQALRDLASLPGPSPLVLAALLPAVFLMLLAGILRRLGVGAPPLHGVSPEAVDAASRTMGWAVRAVAAGAIFVFVAPALLQLVGLRTISLTTGSMAPAYPAGSLLAVTTPADRAAIPAGEVVVIAGADGSSLTHRVAEVVRGAAGEVVAYRTRGDALPRLDADPIAPSSVDGVVVAGAPVLGAMRAWMASPLGIAIGLVLAWALAGLGVLLEDDRRRALAGRRAS